MESSIYPPPSYPWLCWPKVIVGTRSSVGTLCFLHSRSLTMHHYISYRQIPSFGRDTIWKFTANSSKMKMLAAQDLENLLQVRVIDILHDLYDSSVFSSVPSLCLMVSCQNRIIREFYDFYLFSDTGTASPSLECIMISLFLWWTMSHLSLATNFKNSKTKPAQVSKWKNLNGSLRLKFGRIRSINQKSNLQVHAQLVWTCMCLLLLSPVQPIHQEYCLFNPQHP